MDGLNKRKENIMIIIAFTNKTSKIIPKIMCRKMKHVAPIFVDKNRLKLIQFVHREIGRASCRERVSARV